MTPEQTSSTSEELRAGFVGDVAKLAGGATLGQGLSVLAGPVLTRLYSPASFGTASVFASMLGVLRVISCLRYELAIMLPARDEDAANLLAGSLFLALVIAGMSVVFVPLLREPAEWLFNAPGLAGYLWLLPVGLLANAGFLALSYWNSRMKRFGHLSVARVMKSVSSSGFKVGFGAIGSAGSGGLIGSGILASVTGVLVLGFHTWRADLRVLRSSVNRRSLKSELRRYKKFPLFNTWSALLNNASWQLPSFLLSSFFSTDVVGYYDLGTRMLRLPMSLVGNAIGQVFFQRAAEAKVEGTLHTLVRNALRSLATLSLFPLVVLALVGRDLFSTVFGRDWAEAGVYAQILSAWTFFWFVSSPLSTLNNVLEEQEFALKFNVALFVTRLASLLVGGWSGNARLALWLYGSSGIAVYGYLMLRVVGSAGVRWGTATRSLISALASALPFICLLGLSKLIGLRDWRLIAVSVLLVMAYFVSVVRKEPAIQAVLEGMGGSN